MKGRGRERESRQGHGARLREGHGMWLAAGCTHGSAGVGRQALAMASEDCPLWSVNVVTHSPEPPTVAAPQPRCCGPCPGPALVQEERDGPAPLAAAPVLKHAAPSWVSEAGSPPLGGTLGGFSCPHVCDKAGLGCMGCLVPPYSSISQPG